MSHAVLALPGCIVRRTPFGWFGIAGDELAISSLVMGHASRDDVVARLQVDGLPSRSLSSSLLRHAADEVARYFDGEPVDLCALPVAALEQTPFQQRVIQHLRRVGYGETLSYGELAMRAGAPRAARAVGTVMSQNRTPLLVPCHRVTASGGRLGGFSAPQGVTFKQALLALEAGAPDAARLLDARRSPPRRRRVPVTTP